MSLKGHMVLTLGMAALMGNDKTVYYNSSSNQYKTGRFDAKEINKARKRKKKRK